jgi:hypothetical protein
VQIDVRPGRLYLFKGKEDGRVRELAGVLRSAGYRLLVVSSRTPTAVRDDLDVPSDSILTLTESVGPNCVDPQNLMVLTDSLMKHIERGGPTAFLIEDLATLTVKNEFQRVLRMIGYVCESLALNRGVGIVVVDPLTLEPKDMAFLAKEGCVVEEKNRLDMRSLLPRTVSENHPAQNV